jgi:hypothetical protein
VQYQVKQLGIGGVLDQTIALLKNRFGLLLGITMVLLVPYQFVAGLVTVAMMPTMPNQPTAADVAEFQRQYLASLPTIIPVSLLFLVIVWPVTNAAITFAVANEYLGRPITIGGAIGRAFRIVLPYIGAGVLFNLAFVGGMILCFIPGIVAALWFGLWGQVVVIEGITGVGALKRSKFLMKGSISEMIVLGVIVLVINASIGVATNLVPEPHVRVLASAIVQGVLFAFTGTAYVVFYFSCRCKTENFDLTLLADSVSAE